MHSAVLLPRLTSALILACALAACGGSDGGGAAATGSTASGTAKTDTPTQPAAATDPSDVRYAP